MVVRTMKTKGITLTELLIVIILLSVVMVAVMAVNISARRFLTDAQVSSRAQSEASLTLEHIYQNVRLGIGSKGRPGIEYWTGYTGFKVRIDTDGDGRPDEDIDDGIGYYYDSASEEIRFVPDVSVPNPTVLGTYEVIGEGVTAFNYEVIKNFLTMDFTTTRENPVGSVIRSTTLEADVVLRQMSWN